MWFLYSSTAIRARIMPNRTITAIAVGVALVDTPTASTT